MNTFVIKAFLFAMVFNLFGFQAFSADSNAQATLDRNMENAKKVYEQKQIEREQESMRDKTHDNRIKISEKTSLGGETIPPSVNIKISTP